MPNQYEIDSINPVSGGTAPEDDIVRLVNSCNTLRSHFSGATDPATTGDAVAYCTWADSGNGYFKQRNAANNAWLNLWPLDRSHNACQFLAYINQSTNQSVSAGVDTKVQFDSETFDTDGTFDTTNNRHVPNVAGTYLYSASIRYNNHVSANIQKYIKLQKNGLLVQEVFSHFNTVSLGESLVITVLATMNGTTDYMEVYTRHSDSSALTLDNEAHISMFYGYRIK